MSIRVFLYRLTFVGGKRTNGLAVAEVRLERIKSALAHSHISISFCRLYRLFCSSASIFPILCYLKFFLPSFTHPLSIQHMSFQSQKQSFLFNQKERAGSRYFEKNMKGWSGHSMLIVDWAVAVAVLKVSLCLCRCVHMLAHLCVW